MHANAYRIIWCYHPLTHTHAHTRQWDNQHILRLDSSYMYIYKMHIYLMGVGIYPQFFCGSSYLNMQEVEGKVNWSDRCATRASVVPLVAWVHVIPSMIEFCQTRLWDANGRCS